MYRFGEFEVDVGRRELRRRGEPMHLEPQAFDLLVLLLDRGGDVVSKHDLLDGVWGHRFLSEANLTTRVKEVRRALDDDGTRQHTIRNVRGRGYRVVVPVEHIELAARGTGIADGLIGRDDEVSMALTLMSRSPILTIIGPGGVGKSTLARAVARRAGIDRAEVHLVELSTLGAGEDVLPVLARKVAVVLDRDRPGGALRAIAHLDAVVVLDNCEHVIDGVAALLEEVTGVADATVRIIATSRVRLGLSNEALLTLHPLASDAAATLFTARASAVNPGWMLDEVDRPRLDALLDTLDRLPLTIEMAAARLASMTFAELESVLGQRQPLLRVSHRTPAHRHRSLESLVAWSAELLEPGLRRLFNDFSVFAGSVTASDVAAIVSPGDSSDVLFALGSLVERSLLVAVSDGEVTRYRMLVTVRGVAEQWLEDSGRSAEVRRRHAEHVDRVVGEADRLIRSTREIDGRRRLNEIVAEVRVAHQWAQRHAPALASDLSLSLHLAAYSTFWSEPVEWSRALVERYPDASDDDLLGARLVLAGWDANRGELTRARDVAMAAARSSDPRPRMTGLEILSDVDMYAERLVAVAEWTDELDRWGSAHGDAHSVGIAAVNAALALVFSGDPASAHERLDRVDLSKLSPSDRAWVAYTRGEALRAAGDPAARDAFADTLVLARDAGNPFVTSVAQVALAAEHGRAGAIPQAIAVFGECTRDYLDHGNFVHAMTMLRNLIPLLVAVGEDHDAVVLGTVATGDRIRRNDGPESTLASEQLNVVARRVDAEQFAAWVEESHALDVERCVLRAMDVLDRLGG